MTLFNQTIGNQVHYAFSNMPISVLQVLNGLMRKYVWLIAFDDLPATFENGLSYYHFTVRELLNQICHQLSVVLFQIHQVQDQKFVCKMEENQNLKETIDLLVIWIAVRHILKLISLINCMIKPKKGVAYGMKSILRSLFDWIIKLSSLSIVSIAFVRFCIDKTKSNPK